MWRGVRDSELVFAAPHCTVFTLLRALFQRVLIVPAKNDQSKQGTGVRDGVIGDYVLETGQ